MLPIRPLHNKVFFQFEDRVIEDDSGKRAFESFSESGIVTLANAEDATMKARWVKVLAVGPDADKSIEVGSRVCVGALRWTSMLTVDGVDFWQTNDEEILLVEA